MRTRKIMAARMAIAALLTLVSSSARAEAPELIRLQGVISQLQGGPVSDGSYVFEVAIHDVATGGSPILTETITAEVSGGAYTVPLSPSTPGDLRDALASTGPRFVEITVKTDPSGDPVNEVLLPRQQLASVPYALEAPLPSGAIILWDQGDSCPEGFAEAQEFRGMLARGADRSGILAGIPESSGQGCDATPDAQCDEDGTRYDDQLSVAELAPHEHHGLGLGDPSWPLGVVGSDTNPGTLGIDNNNYFYKTSTAGAGDPHYHPFRTVVFCRKD